MYNFKINNKQFCLYPPYLFTPDQGEVQEGSKSIGQSDNDPIELENQIIGNPKSAAPREDEIDFPRIFEISKERRRGEGKSNEDRSKKSQKHSKSLGHRDREQKQ